jgi:hypothetical protein
VPPILRPPHPPQKPLFQPLSIWHKIRQQYLVQSIVPFDRFSNLNSASHAINATGGRYLARLFQQPIETIFQEDGDGQRG